jgi:hypothetical protein
MDLSAKRVNADIASAVWIWRPEWPKKSSTEIDGDEEQRRFTRPH